MKKFLLKAIALAFALAPAAALAQNAPIQIWQLQVATSIYPQDKLVLQHCIPISPTAPSCTYQITLQNFVSSIVGTNAGSVAAGNDPRIVGALSAATAASTYVSQSTLTSSILSNLASPPVIGNVAPNAGIFTGLTGSSITSTGALTVGGASSFKAITATGAVSFTGGEVFTGGAGIDTLFVTGTTTTNGLAVTGSSAFAGISATGAVSFTGGATITGGGGTGIDTLFVTQGANFAAATGPTRAAGDSTTNVATTAFVANADALLQPLPATGFQSVARTFKSGIIPTLHLAKLIASPTPNVCIVGDSTSTVSAADNITPTDLLWGKLQQHLRNAYPNKTFTFSNYAIGGTVLNQFPATMSSGWPSWWTNHSLTWAQMVGTLGCTTLFINYGTNDPGLETSTNWQSALAAITIYPTIPDIVLISNQISNPAVGVPYSTASFQAGLRANGGMMRTIASNYPALGVSNLPPIGLIDVNRYFQMSVNGQDPALQVLGYVVPPSAPISNISLATPYSLATTQGDLAVSFTVPSGAALAAAGSTLALSLADGQGGTGGSSQTNVSIIFETGGTSAYVGYYGGSGPTPLLVATLTNTGANTFTVSAQNDHLLVTANGATVLDTTQPRYVGPFIPTFSLTSPPAAPNNQISLLSYAAGTPRPYMPSAGAAACYGGPAGSGTYSGNGINHDSSWCLNGVYGEVLDATEFVTGIGSAFAPTINPTFTGTANFQALNATGAANFTGASSFASISATGTVSFGGGATITGGGGTGIDSLFVTVGAYFNAATGPTRTLGDSTTNFATTAFVQTATAAVSPNTVQSRALCSGASTDSTTINAELQAMGSGTLVLPKTGTCNISAPLVPKAGATVRIQGTRGATLVPTASIAAIIDSTQGNLDVVDTTMSQSGSLAGAGILIAKGLDNAMVHIERNIIAGFPHGISMTGDAIHLNQNYLLDNTTNVVCPDDCVNDQIVGNHMLGGNGIDFPNWITSESEGIAIEHNVILPGVASAFALRVQGVLKLTSHDNIYDQVMSGPGIIIDATTKPINSVSFDGDYIGANSGATGATNGMIVTGSPFTVNLENVTTAGWHGADVDFEGGNFISIHKSNFISTTSNYNLILHNAAAVTTVSNHFDSNNGSIQELGSTTHTSILNQFHVSPVKLSTSTYLMNGGDTTPNMVFTGNGNSTMSVISGNGAVELQPYGSSANIYGIYASKGNQPVLIAPNGIGIFAVNQNGVAALTQGGGIPSAAPAVGTVFLYVDPNDNKLKAEGSSGTITVLAVP